MIYIPKRNQEMYEEIINTQWPRQTLRAKMPLKDRAKIFLPFAALKGYEESLEYARNLVNEDDTYGDELLLDN